MVQLIR